ncbi:MULTISPECIES: hypothetical protein [Streptomyces]|uniref:Uncharacterized protein n=2 Tax=Streptomyces TaxID=1883 RepID=A0ABV9J1L9_9ACTN
MGLHGEAGGEAGVCAGLGGVRTPAQGPFRRQRRGSCFTRIDHLPLLRPLRSWATAWSRDRLRVCQERGITPQRALVNWLAEIAVRAGVVAFAVTGFGLESGLRLFGPFAASLAYLCPLLLSVAVCVALFKAPLAGTPAARRVPRAPEGRR